jgi:predicted P-loop ATPase
MNVDEFLGFLFPGVNGDDPNEVVAIGGDEQNNTAWEARPWRPGEVTTPGRLYYCISTVVGPANSRQRNVLKDTAHLVRTWVIVLDDVGTKVDASRIPVQPTTRLETSPGNFQWIYRLAYPVKPIDAHNLIEGLADAGYTDGKAKRADRYMRVPGSLNTKLEVPFRARVVEHHPERQWSLARLTVLFRVVPGAHAPALEELPALQEGEVDPDWDIIQALDMVSGPAARGWYPVVCPNEAQHSPSKAGGKDSSTAYRPSKGGGVFNCQHEHCKHLTTPAFREWLHKQLIPDLQAFGQRLEDLVANPPAPEPGQETVRFRPRAPARPAGHSVAQRLAEHIEPHNLGPWTLPDPNMTAKGGYAMRQPVTDARVHAVMQAIGLVARRNMMTWEIEATLEGYETLENPENMMALLVHACTRCGMDAPNRIHQAAGAFADAHRYHPVLDWIDNGPEWDGVDRIAQLAATLTMRDPRLSKWRDIVVRRWLIQVAVAMTNWQREVPTDVGYCLVLQGRENIGKSKWVQHALLPGQWATGGMTLKLNTGERDAVRRATMTPIVELGEVNATFKKSDTADLKNFLTTTADTYRAPYGRGEEKRPRCTGYVATVNPAGFLVDATGERRFWTLAVALCNWKHDIDLQQLWMQVCILAEDGEQYWLTDEEIALHAEVSDEHQVDSDVLDIMRDLEHRRQGKGMDATWVHVTAKELLEHYSVAPREVFRSRVELNARLERCGWAQNAAVKGKRGWWVPPYRASLTNAQKSGLRVIRTLKGGDDA